MLYPTGISYSVTGKLSLLEASINFYNLDVTKLLLDHGANPCIKDNHVLGTIMRPDGENIKNLILQYGGNFDHVRMYPSEAVLYSN